jgi:hypothetical protein
MSRLLERLRYCLRGHRRGWPWRLCWKKSRDVPL